ncbi:MAG: YhjD/YihY/BrkB family envelope integrity protein, partial [Acidiferrobacterales bacterium]
MSTWKRLDELVRRKIDGADRAADVWPKVWLIRSLQLIYLVIRDLLRGQLSLRAMSLVYTTMLSLVPLLAVTFSVLKAFGVHNQAEPLLDNLLAGLGPKGAEITDR